MSRRSGHLRLGAFLYPSGHHIAAWRHPEAQADAGVNFRHYVQAATLLFEVGGASATSETRRFDRHWRNARTLASHNPAAQREASIGRYYLNGTPSEERFSLPHAEGQGIAAGVPPQRAAARSAQAALAEVGR